jgi:hypothetical protein
MDPPDSSSVSERFRGHAHCSYETVMRLTCPGIAGLLALPFALAPALGCGEPPQPETTSPEELANRAAVTRLTSLRRADLAMTEGTVSFDRHTGTFTTGDDSKTRGETHAGYQQAAELGLSYLRDSTQQDPLGSGLSMRQIGLKLRVSNACNLVYVMWRDTPRPGPRELAVLVKSNPGKTTSSQCHNAGYELIKTVTTGPLADGFTDRAEHTLRADLDDALNLVVSIDRARVLAAPLVHPSGPQKGQLVREVTGFGRGVGFRTDNAIFRFRLSAGPRL